MKFSKDTSRLVECGRWSIAPSNEATKWRWVYRDLSGYVPPGGAS